MTFRRRTIIAILATTVVIVVTLSGVILNQYRASMIIENPILDVKFEHAKHKEEPCANCHHNFIDDSKGAGGCYDCHKYTEEINVKIEATFHEFCSNCHTNKARDHLDTGPLRQCSLCHIDDQIVN